MFVFSENAMLLVVDMQTGFLRDEAIQVIPTVRALCDGWSASGRDIVFTQFANPSDSLYERLMDWRQLRSPSDTQITPELRDYASIVIKKNGYTPFTREFCSLLDERRWECIVICGVATESCVLKSAVDAFERGIIPIVVADACSSHAGNSIHKMGLTVIARFIGINQIVDSKELFRAMSI